MPSRFNRLFRRTLPAVLMTLVFAGLAAAQETGAFPQASAMAQQSLRPYWHVFIAYAIAVVFILGWVISIARRLSALERRLAD